MGVKKYKVSVSETVYYDFEIEVDDRDDVEEQFHALNYDNKLDWDDANLFADSQGLEVNYIEEVEEDE